MMKTRERTLTLERILEPVSSSLNDEAARKLVGLRADRKSRSVIAKLAEKCNQGTLTPSERREYEMLAMANHFIAILKAKARIRLADKARIA